MTDYKIHGLIPDRAEQLEYTHNKEEQEALKALPEFPVDISLNRLTHHQSNTAIDRFLQTYNPLAFEGQNDAIFALVCELSESMVSLVQLAKYNMNRPSLKDSVESQQRAAFVLSKINDLPIPVAERLRAMIADATKQAQNDVQHNIVSLYR